MHADPIPALKRRAAEAIKPLLARHYDPAAALLIGADRARVSDIRRGRLNRFSLDTLLRYATRLGLEVELRIVRREVR